MIPTRLKLKIPKTHSYPLSAKAISEALPNVPQEQLLVLNFSFYRPIGVRQLSVPHGVLQVGYSGPSPFSEPEWVIPVSAVPRVLKYKIQNRLVSEALPKIRNWLIANPHSLDREGAHWLKFSFDELKDEITSREFATPDWQTQRL